MPESLYSAGNVKSTMDAWYSASLGLEESLVLTSMCACGWFAGCCPVLAATPQLSAVVSCYGCCDVFVFLRG